MASAWLGPIHQIGYLVDDLDHALRHWVTATGVGPWTCFRDVVLEGHHRDSPATITMQVALSYQHDMQIELIQVTSSGVSPYSDRAGRVRPGIHHLATWSDDLDAALKSARERGLDVLFQGGNEAMRVAYLHHPQQPEAVFECVEMTPEMSALFEQIKTATRAWDGNDPIRTIDMG